MSFTYSDSAAKPVLIQNGVGSNASYSFLGTVGGKTALVSGTFTRPADTTPYTANDVVANSTSAATPLELTGATRLAAGSGYITKVKLLKSTASATNAVFRIWFYLASPTSNGNDNASFSLLWANRASQIGYVDISLTTEGGSSTTAGNFVSSISIPFKLAAGTSIYAVLEAKAAYTPGSEEQFYIEAMIEQN